MLVLNYLHTSSINPHCSPLGSYAMVCVDFVGFLEGVVL
jgi:hypothetical protein